MLDGMEELADAMRKNRPPPPDDENFDDLPEHEEKPRIEIVHFDDMVAHLEDRCVVGDLLGAGEMSLVVGASGAGKSFFVIDQSLHIAGGREWFGRRTQQTGVLYIASEAGKGIINRIAAYRSHYPEIPNGLNFAAVVSPVDLHDPKADLAPLISSINDLGYRPGMIIVDTLSRAMGGGDENSPDGMGSFIMNMDSLRHYTEAHVQLVHDFGKNTGKGARGHTSLHAAVDTELEVTRNEGSKISTARVTKQRELPTEGSFSFSLTPIILGYSQFGEPVTSCVLEPVEQDAAEIQHARKKLNAAEKIALNQLSEVLATAGEVPPASNHIPKNTRCVMEKVWQEYCYRGGISDGEEHAQRTAFRRAARSLAAEGRIGIWEPWVWLV
jgi:RecA-family ATPase